MGGLSGLVGCLVFGGQHVPDIQILGLSVSLLDEVVLSLEFLEIDLFLELVQIEHLHLQITLGVLVGSVSQEGLHLFVQIVGLPHLYQHLILLLILCLVYCLCQLILLLLRSHFLQFQILNRLVLIPAILFPVVGNRGQGSLDLLLISRPALRF